MLLATRRLPGIRVDVAPPPAVEALPRMDVAVLVGFASTGPLHLPVAIESTAQFAAVFGPDAPLAWDDVRGERAHAYLGAAVRAFFSNGGRRCWVIRVAEVEREDRTNPLAAKSNRFPVPGVLEVGADGKLRVAQAQARCEGSWSDGLSVACAARQTALIVEDIQALSSPESGRYTLRTRFDLRPGDLIGLSDGAEICYASVDAVGAAPDPANSYSVDITVQAAFERLANINPSPSTSSPSVEWIGTAELEGFSGSVTAVLSPPTNELKAVLSSPMDKTGHAQLRFDDPVPAGVAQGNWAKFNSGSSMFWVRIDRLIERSPVFAGSPEDLNSSVVEATVEGPAWRELGAILPVTAGGVPRAHLVSLDLRVDDDTLNLREDNRRDHQSFRMNPVGLTPAHANAWWDQRPDAEFYRPREDIGAGRATQPVADEVPRFPLARRTEPVPRAWIPLGVEPLFGHSLARFAQEGSALERDGLSLFDASLFLDPELAAASMHAIAEVADSIRYLRPHTRTLRGMHAAWSIGAGGLFNEASLLAIPDAIHLGWQKRGTDDVARSDGLRTDAPAHWRTHRGACAAPVKELLDQPDSGEFIDSSTRKLETPELTGPDGPVPPGVFRLTWNDCEPEANYLLLESTTPDFKNAREFDCGRNIQYVVSGAREGIYYYQVFARTGDERSSGSRVIAIVVRADEWVLKRAGEINADAQAQWLKIQRAALRMAAASGELFAVMSMPLHFHTQEALRYTQRLRAVRQPVETGEPEAFGFTEARALSHGAMYFPWLQSSGHITPPDGVALGVLAARASARGAWIAPANVPIRNVEALTPMIGARDWHTLQDAQINLLRADPRGFLTLSADTLATELDLRPINVRRLLILLRRLALRRGISYVFEPNGPVLRRAVQRGFTILLNDLFRRGAFAGETAEQSFRVVTDDTINTKQDAEAGRFMVELRVAPSIPMRFIAVQLAQSGARLSVSEEL